MKIIGGLSSESDGGDARFHFESEIEDVRKRKEHSTFEIEVKVRTGFVGEFDYGHFRFGIWDMGEPGYVGDRYLCFKGALLHHGPGSLAEGTKDAYYHGGGPMEEISALFALHFRTSFEPGRTVRMDDLPRRFSMDAKNRPATTLIRNNLEDGKETLDLARSMRQDRKLSFMLGLKFYSQALRQMDSEPDLAFISLISAVEAVAGTHYSEDVVGFDDEMEQLLARIEDQELQSELRQVLWRRAAVKRKVLKFFADYITPEFWSDSTRPPEEWQRVQEADYLVLMKRMYDVRSGFLHAGKPIPPMVFHSVGGAEMDSSSSMQSGMRKWERNEYLPHISFIERLVNHLLNEYLKKNQE